jgi:hypothetical protein
MTRREFRLEEPEPHIRNKGSNPEFENPRRKEERRKDTRVLRKSHECGTR